MLYNQRGQTLVIVLTIMILALSIGVSISTRFIRNIRNTSNISSSDRALAVAEAGVEHMLALSMESLSEYITNNSCGSACSFQIMGTDGIPSTATVTLSFDGNTSSAYNFSLDTMSTSEINLAGYPSNTNLQICINNTSLSNPLSVYVLYLYGSVGSYKADNYYIQNFGCINITGRTNPKALRLRSVYDDVSGTIVPATNTTIPSQGIIIESIGSVGDIHKKVTVLKKVSSLSTDFDYVLYSKSETEPLSN